MPALPSNHSSIQEHKDNSHEDDRNNTRLAAELGVEQVAQGEPGRLLEEHRGWDTDKSAQDTSTTQDLRSTTSQAGSRATHETSVHRAKRRYRVRESDRCGHAKQA